MSNLKYSYIYEFNFSAGITENDLDNNYNQAFFGNDKEKDGENWKTLIRINTAFLLNERINAALMKIEANKKLPKKSSKSLSEKVVNEKEQEEIEKFIGEFKQNYKEFVEENKNEIKNDWKAMKDLLQFEKMIENASSEDTPLNKIMLTNVEFGSLNSNLLELGGEEAYEKLEEKLKKFLGQLHFERFNFSSKMQFTSGKHVTSSAL